MNLGTEISIAKEVLNRGGVILYPSDTIWGLGALASSKEGCERIFEIKQRPKDKSLIMLVSNYEMLESYVGKISDDVKVYLEKQTQPTTLIYKANKNCPKYMVSEKGEIAIRLVKHELCNNLIESLGEGITSSSANISGNSAPVSFAEISKEIKDGVDFIVSEEYESNTAKPSKIVRFVEGKIEVIRA